MIGFYSRPIEAAETTMWVDLAPAWAIHNSTRGCRPVLTKLSLFDFCDRTGQGIFSSDIYILVVYNVHVFSIATTSTGAYVILIVYACSMRSLLFGSVVRRIT